MGIKYQPQEFEKKWVEIWEKEKIYQTLEPVNLLTRKQKQYILSMFPYPSGAGLHVGHVRIYTGTDVLARFFRMNGYPVLHPMGWDAFGLPAENAAIKAKKNPMDMVPEHIANFKRQMKMLGFSYDWEREFSTTEPEYYKWTQWLFIQFFKMGLLYKKNAPINYCPKCKTGLAEEEVLPDGTHERCGNKITKKDLPQWIFAITKYADRLLSDLECLDWPDGILAMQRNWIGRKEGINIKYKVINEESRRHVFSTASPTKKGAPKRLFQKQVSSLSFIDEITCFTTRPDTNFGATFIVVAPEHEFVKKIINGEIKSEKADVEAIKKYVEEAKSKTELERQAEGRKKTGVFTGFYAINNLNCRELPIYVSDFVLMGFGTGAVVGVPGHDKRDFEFAKEFNLEIIRVVKGKDGDISPITRIEQVQEEEGTMINSEFLNGMDIHQATKKMMDYLEEKGWGKRVVTYHLRDWIFSRQRYWGEPIPMVYCQKCAENKIDYWHSDLFKKNLRIGIFVDNANLFYAQKENGWKVDIKKLKEFFLKEGNVVFTKYFIALPKKEDPSYQSTKKYIEKIKSEVEIISKPLKYIREGKKIIKKGDVDVDLVISVINEIEKIDVVIVVSGDSDYLPLVKYLLKKGKKIIFVGFKKNLAWELKKTKYLILDRFKEELSLGNKKTPIKNRGVLSKILYPKLFNLSSNNLFGWFPIPEDELPLKLPYVKSYEPTETGESPLSKIKEFVNTSCPNCGEPAKRETDTMPNWAGSCWYFIRFAQNQKSKIKNQKLEEEWIANTVKNSWLPVDWYLGGAEHAVLHLLYARFWVKALYDLGLLDFKEPFLRLRNVGMVLAEDHRKMSKSFGNVINPDDVVAEYGADALRLYEMFMAPFSAEIAWSTKALQGCYRFLKRVWEIYHLYQIQNSKIKNQNDNEKCKMEGNKELESRTAEVKEERSDGKTLEVKLVAKLNKTIKKVTNDIKQIKFNTAIAAMMEFVNEWEEKIQKSKFKKQINNEKLKKNKIQNAILSIENAKKFLQILAPFAPFMTEEIWRNVFGEKTSIHLSAWPEAEEIEDQEVIIPVQVNGKLRGTIKVQSSRLPAGTAKFKVQSYIEKEALRLEKVKKYLEGKKYKMIYVEGRVVNFVTH